MNESISWQKAGLLFVKADSLKIAHPDVTTLWILIKNFFFYLKINRQNEKELISWALVLSNWVKMKDILEEKLTKVESLLSGQLQKIENKLERIENQSKDASVVSNDRINKLQEAFELVQRDVSAYSDRHLS